MRMSLMSHSKASSFVSAACGSSSGGNAGLRRPSPVSRACAMIRSASRVARRGSSDWAWAYSSNNASSAAVAPCVPACGQRRGEMADGHRGGAPLGLGGLARVVDDERIDQRGRPKDRARRTGVRQRGRLARQPLQRAVGAAMDDGMNPLDGAQPEVEGDIAVARRQQRVVVVGLAGGGAAAVRLHGDDQVAGARRCGSGTSRLDRCRRQGRPKGCEREWWTAGRR